MEHALSFLDPAGWYAAELERAHRAIDESPDRVTIVYFCSAAGLACKFGRDGVDQILDMGRTAVNVMGNCMATAVVARWEGVLDDEAVRRAA